MTDNTRAHILARLNRATGKAEIVPVTTCLPIRHAAPGENIARLKHLLESVRTEVYLIEKERWTDTLKAVLKKRDLKTLLYAPRTPIGPQIEGAWQAEFDQGLPSLCAYETDIETVKEKLFQIDAAITTSVGAIAENGAVVLWPDTDEPRLMSLVPPVHIVILEEENIYTSFGEIIEEQNWAQNMPTNVVLISGPSRTADIEMTVAFGVHGPKELIVFIRLCQNAL